jgi:hypothetical protein
VLVVNELPKPQPSNAEVCEGAEHTFDAGEFTTYSWVGPEGFTSAQRTITVKVAGTYTVTVTTDKSCSNTADHVLVVKALPEPMDSGFEVCDGEEHTFDAGEGFVSYAWTGPEGFEPATTQTITVKVAGTYVVNVTNEKGCAAEAYHTLVVNPLPVAEIAAAAEVCASSAANAASTAVAPEGQVWVYLWEITNGEITEGQGTATIKFTAGGDAMQPVVLKVTVTTEFGCEMIDTAVIANKACDEGCSLTMGGWGSTGGAGNVPLVKSLIGLTGMKVGKSPNTFTLVETDAPCLVQVLPAGGTGRVLNGSALFTSGQPKCTTNPNLLSKTGKLNNVFLGQMLTLTLNTRWSSDLLNITLCPTMKTQKVLHTETGDVLDPGLDMILGTADDPIKVVTIPQTVLLALDRLELPRTVAGLFELGNRALGGVPNLGVSVSDVNKAIDAINIGFDECRIKIDCVPVSTLTPQATALINTSKSFELCNAMTTYDVQGQEDTIVFSASVLKGIQNLNRPVDLKGFAELATLAQLGRPTGVPIDELNLAIDEVNTVAAEGLVIGGCAQ